MYCRITELQLRSVCRELLRQPRPVTHRELRAVLRDRFGAMGKTERVLRAWREEAARLAAARELDNRPVKFPTLPIDVQELQKRLNQSEAERAALKTRAELAELREVSHQTRWALEIDSLRERLRGQPNHTEEIRKLQGTVMRLTVEMERLRNQLAERTGEGGAA